MGAGVGGGRATGKRLEGARGDLLRVALRGSRAHPAIHLYLADALWSINERLAGRPGADLAPLSRGILADYVALALEEAEQMKQAPGTTTSMAEARAMMEGLGG